MNFFAHALDHTSAEKYGGLTDEANLAYTCWRCTSSLQQPAVPAFLYRTILTFLASNPTASQIAAFRPTARM